MHGRLKVRTSAEEAIRKRKEQDQKAKAFRSGMSRVLAKKAAGELDDEMMVLTGKILGSNPDIATLWNLRRLCILKLFDEDKENQKLFDNDLGFTEMCLQVNPKSYCAWHHRCWVLENAPSPNWQKEVDLCTKYLKLDERNFHCWDYRRYVTEKAKIPAEKELEFCTEKIRNNFSNYSSWHYRSKLLPVLHPNKDDPSRPISEEKLREELELVLTAAFTDPNDSSAWFYQRWLLGYSQPELDIAAFRIEVARKLAVVTFTRPVNLRHKNVNLSFNFTNEMNHASNWVPASASDSYCVTWILRDVHINLPDHEEYVLSFTDEYNMTHSLKCKKLCNASLFGINKPKFEHEFGQSIVDVLKAQLESCQQLLEYEPDSKWTLLTAALLMKALDAEGYHDRILGYLEKLQEVDPLRVGYYRDLTAKWSIEIRLKRWIDEGKPQKKLDLSNLKLNRVTYEQYLAVAGEIDLSGNKLGKEFMHKHFVFCQRLSL
ncbi:geranylgeranyl transferase type-2 subunit alpha [Toxorhynchites rutilus septentrionalis]|uniref:geranylgeranyl transferase type-2 subunit alpha n=1 Tax=Toxorhynchites rutilus septentrionalis TaxID=329112 RepID=UPI00247A6414|nr:geranylgeranyl transferase type-2 subunit alpha [Toxorhynchites rutilus septentrionalis]